jgi:hypothetical protein
MEFMNRSASQHAAPARVGGGEGGVAGPSGKRGGRWKESPGWLRITWVVLLFSATVVLAALAVLLYLGGPKEENLVDKSKNQAVFIDNGQVYFGKINSVNSKFLDLRDIYYLNVNQQVQPNQDNKQPQNNITLVKLGCELHGPVDQMIINREHVTFWENLKDDGQVTKAVNEWVKQNPEGQKCQTAATNNTNNNSDSNRP